MDDKEIDKTIDTLCFFQGDLGKEMDRLVYKMLSDHGIDTRGARRSKKIRNEINRQMAEKDYYIKYGLVRKKGYFAIFFDLLEHDVKIDETKPIVVKIGGGKDEHCDEKCYEHFGSIFSLSCSLLLLRAEG